MNVTKCKKGGEHDSDKIINILSNITLETVINGKNVMPRGRFNADKARPIVVK